MLARTRTSLLLAASAAVLVVLTGPAVGAQRGQQPRYASTIQIYDFATHASKAIHHADDIWEAPNWIRDGRFLLSNSGGKLYRVPIDGGEPIALVFDTAGGKPLSARQRKMWTDWLAEHDALLRRRLAGVGIVVTSALMRGVFTGVFWVWQPPIPYMFTGTVREADAWARERLAGAARAKR